MGEQAQLSGTSKVPTLKYIVSQSLGAGPDPKEAVQDNSPREGNGFANRAAIITEAPKKNPKEGSGDIAATITNYLNTQAEVDVGNLIAAAYEKGSALFQAGAELAYQIFSEDQLDGRARNKPRSRDRRGQEIGRRGNESGPVVCQAPEVRRIPSCQQQQQTPRILTARAREITSSQGLAAIQPQVLRKTSTISAGPAGANELLEDRPSDDTAFYNGYSIRVRGRHVALETLYVNGSGPSKKPLEIRIRLNLPPPRPGLYGQLTREYGGPRNEVLLLKYVHGDVDGLVDVTCPPHVQPQTLTAEVNTESHLVITAP